MSFLGSHVRAVPAQNVLKAHVERAVRVRCERVPVLACYVPRPRVLVAYRVVDPYVERLAVAKGFESSARLGFPWVGVGGLDALFGDG